MLEPAVENNHDAKRTLVFIKFWQNKHNIMESGSPASTTRKRRAQWISQQMENAVKMVERGILSTYAAAARYNIPRRTLRNHLKSGSTTRKLGRSAILTTEHEAGLVRRIIRLADVGVPMTSKMLRIQAFSFCKIKKIPNTFNDAKNAAGKKWLRLFLKRHPELARRKAQMMNPARAQKLNKDIVGDHFSKYKSVLDRLGIEHKPESIYNIDEKNCRISLHHQQEVLTARGRKRVHQIANEHAESVTVVGCGNAIGSAIPPMILFKGKRLKPEFQDNLPPGSLVKMTPKGSMTTETFIEFINHLNKYRTSGPCLLIFDGAKCHLDFTIVEEAEKCGITLYCLPSNTTHELQPMDKSVYRSFEHHWDQELIKYVSQHPERSLNKTSFNVILSQVWPKCMTISNITNGFRATGLYPYNPDAISEEAFAPSALSELPVPSNRKNIAVFSDALREQATSTGNVEDSDGSGTDTENLPLSLLSKNKSPNSGTPNKINKQSTTCEVHDFLPTPKFKVKPTLPRKKSLNYRAQEVTKDLFGDNATNSTSQITVPSSRKEDVPGTSSMMKINTKSPKVAVTGCTSAQPAVTATRHRTSVKTVSLIADKLTGSKPKRRDNKSSSSSWYCPACNEDRVDDMRQCLTCDVWYHELCVGLTPAEKIFYCSGDCLKKKMKKAD
ncbi:uncharacterized protein LOC111352973 [Spodoptera litura]|uniref:Uncharacterized protein LOC111352973 n=1 Tax=Spodoptera litura TaxID=69820 RepID=A0A9J7E008_SPOLT|nr:uncharacterized protein LOC111352973 [Spodoptera litura]